MKDFSKTVLNFLATILIFPLYVLYFLCSRFCEERRSFAFYSQLLSLFPGVFGVFLRRAFYRLSLESCSSDAWISFGTVFSTSKISLGKQVYLGQYCILGEVSIGDETIVASRVSITSGLEQHSFDSLEIPIREQKGNFQKITIGNDCWLGEGAIVAADVANQVVVGAGSVVVKPVSSAVIVAGNPASVIKERTL